MSYRQNPEDKPDFWSDERHERDALSATAKAANLRRRIREIEAQHPLFYLAPDHVLVEYNTLCRALISRGEPA